MWWYFWWVVEVVGVVMLKCLVIFECVGVLGIIDGIIVSVLLFLCVVVVGVCMGLDYIWLVMVINKEINLWFVFGYILLEFCDMLYMLVDGKVNVVLLIIGMVGLFGVVVVFDVFGDFEVYVKIMIDFKSNVVSF